jgi:ribosomal protein S27E
MRAITWSRFFTVTPGCRHAVVNLQRTCIFCGEVLCSSSGL